MQAQGELSQSVVCIDELLERDDLQPMRRVDLLYFRATAALQSADQSTAQEILEAALAILETQPDPGRSAYLEIALGWASANRGDWDSARHHVEQARAAARGSGDPEIIAAVDACLPMAGCDSQIVPTMLAALATARAHGNDTIVRMALINLSETALSSPDQELLARSVEWGVEAHALCIEVGDLDGASMGAGNAGAALLLRGGDPTQAINSLRGAMHLATRGSDIVIQVENLLRIAAAEAARGNRVKAERLLQRWHYLRSEHDLGVSESNQRLLDTYLRDFTTVTSITSPLLVTLGDAIAEALTDDSAAPSPLGRPIA
jgi:hypothetical protein